MRFALMLRKSLLLIFTVWLTAALLALPAYAQVDKKVLKDKKKKEKKALKEAKKFLSYEEYGKAIPFLETAYEQFQDNPQTNFWLGKCYYLTGKQNKCLPLIEAAYKANPKIDEQAAAFYARALHYNLRFDEAIEYYNIEKKEFDIKSPEFLSIERRIQQCTNGKELIKAPVDALIQNLGPNINTPYPDFAPVITADESIMIFTTRRPGNFGTMADDGLYYEDIYQSEKQSDNNWAPAVKLNETINTVYHDASIALSADGQKLFLFKYNNGGDIYVSDLKGKDWSEPVSIGKNINTKAWEPSVWLSADNKYLFYVSDKKGGFGGRDIYISVKNEKGQWIEGVNAGSTINTPFDEDAPFLHPDGKTLYFSSEGHTSMGGFDIFKSTWLGETNWTKPANMGYPINTADDDIYFVLSASGQHGYFASAREDGLGDKDIYRINFKKPDLEKVVIKDKVEPQAPDMSAFQIVDMTSMSEAVTILKGIVINADSKVPVEAILYVIDNITGDTVNELTSNSASGKYLVTLTAGRNYNITAKADGYLFHSENFDIPDTAQYIEKVVDIELQPMMVGSSVVLKNIFFEFDKADLKPESETELMNLVKILKDMPKMRIRIGGHTDSKGSDDYNQKLSEARAKSVVQYLIDKGGIDPERLEYVGYGETKPIATNDTDEGRALNRRTEFEVISIK